MPAVVRLFDTAQGRPLADPITHKTEIVAVALSQQGIAPDRKVTLQTALALEAVEPPSQRAPSKSQHPSMQRHHG